MGLITIVSVVNFKVFDVKMGVSKLNYHTSVDNISKFLKLDSTIIALGTIQFLIYEKVSINTYCMTAG